MTKIKTMRIKAGYTQTMLAKAVGVSQSAVAQWEKGRTSPKSPYLPKIARTLSCLVDDLIDEEAS